ncbi:hypothetical protein ACHAPO_009268 [Fusarium lateritium]
MPSAMSAHIEQAIVPDEHVKLILCFDGTGNTFSGTNADTNVVKILRKLDRNNNKQYHYYQTGIGTYDVNESSIHKSTLGEVKSKVSKVIDQGFGTTFDAHIMAGYRFLMRYYEPQAKIYIFGFSRGAYTAKYLSRMVNKVGLLCKGNEEMVPFAYRLYARALECESADRLATQKGSVWGMGGPEELPPKTNSETSLNGNNQPNDAPNGFSNGASNGVNDSSSSSSDSSDDEHAPAGAEEPTETDDEEDKTTFMAGNVNIKRGNDTKKARREVKAFSQTFCRNEGSDPKDHKNIKVFFLGMWDCVNSVAVVEKNAPAPVEITGTAKHVRHAVAVDERRVKFKPALLAQDIRTVVKEAQDKAEARRKKGKNPKKSKKSVEQRKKEEEENKEDIREVWFPGNHGDIGGGWPAMPELVSPDKLPWYTRLGNVLTSMKPKKNEDEPLLRNNDLQMSDMALDWMIREVTLVGDQEPKSAVHWCHTLDKFRNNMDDTKTLVEGKTKLQRYVIEGFKHDTLSFGYGSSVFKVILWKFMECLPGIPRWELNDKSAKEEDKGWESRRWTPNFGSFRDIPRRAVLHNSLIERLKAQDINYRPGNNHGRGTPCLLGAGKKEVAKMKKAELQNQKELSAYTDEREKTWAARHQLWQLEPKA